MNTPPESTSPWVMPGTYTVRLTVDGKEYTQQLTIRMDPRIKTSFPDLQLQHDLSLMCYSNIKKCKSVLTEIAAKNDSSLDKTVSEFTTLEDTFITLHNLLQESDMPPTVQMITEVKEAENRFEKAMYPIK